VDKVNAEIILKEFQAVKTRRAPWESVFELIARYMLQRKQGFTSTEAPGNFYTHEDVLDSTAGQALHTMVSSLDGALWKSNRTFQITPPRQVRDSKVIKDFYAEINSRLQEQMEDEYAAFGTARKEALLEGGAFGTDAIGVFRARKPGRQKVEYRALPIKNLYVVEDSRGRVVKEFYEFEYDAFQLVEEYGEAAKTDKVKSLLEANNRDTKLKVLWVVRPRAKVDPTSEGVQKYSYESIHILSDEKTVLREGGYSSNPIIVTRFYKNEGEEYGRSPAFNALSPTIELNALVEIITKGGELTILPSWYVLDDGTFGNGVIDRSPGGVIPIDVTSSRITGMAPIGQIGAVGSLQSVLKLVEWLMAEINAHFFVDKLTDLNNSTRMTLGEAQIRNELRADNTGAIFSRQIDEKLVPVIRRTIAVLEEEGELGVIPGSPLFIRLVASGRVPLVLPPELLELKQQGVELYNIKFISPAARILRSEELRGVMSLCQFAAGFSGVKPEWLLWLDDDKIMPMASELFGATDEILVSKEEYQKRFEAFMKSRQAQQQLEAAQMIAETGAKEASANQQNAQAQATTAGSGGMPTGGQGNYMDLVM